MSYPLTDLIIDRHNEGKKLEFTFEDTEDDTYDKLKNLTALDHEKIVESEGLPFSYIINLMEELSEIMKLKSENFIYQIEKVFNTQFELMNREQCSVHSENLH